MATGWSYSELSKLAKKFGGPEKMLEIMLYQLWEWNQVVDTY